MEERINEMLTDDFCNLFSSYNFEKEDRYKVVSYILQKKDKAPIDTLRELKVQTIHSFNSIGLSGALTNVIVNLIVRTYEIHEDNQIIKNIIKEEE